MFLMRQLQKPACYVHPKFSYKPELPRNLLAVMHNTGPICRSRCNSRVTSRAAQHNSNESQCRCSINKHTKHVECPFRVLRRSVFKYPQITRNLTTKTGHVSARCSMPNFQSPSARATARGMLSCVAVSQNAEAPDNVSFIMCPQLCTCCIEAGDVNNHPCRSVSSVGDLP